MKKLAHNHNRGFTLLEALVAILVISVSIAAAFSIAPSGIAATRYARNQITASYLAQEAMEIVINRRDTGMYCAATWDDWTSELNSYIGQTSTANGSSNELFVCAGSCEPVRVKDTANGPLYGNGPDFNSANSDPTIFTREVSIDRVIYSDGDDPDEHKADRELAVTVRVTWNDLGSQKEAIVHENLNQFWHPNTKASYCQ